MRGWEGRVKNRCDEDAEEKEEEGYVKVDEEVDKGVSCSGAEREKERIGDGEIEVVAVYALFVLRDIGCQLSFSLFVVGHSKDRLITLLIMSMDVGEIVTRVGSSSWIDGRGDEELRKQ